MAYTQEDVQRSTIEQGQSRADCRRASVPQGPSLDNSMGAVQEITNVLSDLTDTLARLEDELGITTPDPSAQLQRDAAPTPPGKLAVLFSELMRIKLKLVHTHARLGNLENHL